MKHLAFVLVTAAAFVAPASADAAWPLHPRQGPHPVRAGVLDPVGPAACFEQGVGLPDEERHCHPHGGVDIVVDETRCAPRAPRGMCKRLFAIEPGRVWKKRNRDRADKCSGIVHVGRFTYGHVFSGRKLGRWVKRGQPIGWTCAGWWHIHIGELPRGFRKPWPGPTRLNPLRPGGPLASFNRADHDAPELLEFRHVDGELWGRIEDPTPTVRLGGIARLGDRLHPYNVSVNGRMLWSARRVLGTADPWRIYAPPAYRNRTAPECGADVEGTDCSGERWFRLGVHEPDALVHVRAVDSAGNVAEVADTPARLAR